MKTFTHTFHPSPNSVWSKTAEPQFQATATPIFKNLMSGRK